MAIKQQIVTLGKFEQETTNEAAAAMTQSLAAALDVPFVSVDGGYIYPSLDGESFSGTVSLRLGIDGSYIKFIVGSCGGHYTVDNSSFRMSWSAANTYYVGKNRSADGSVFSFTLLQASPNAAANIQHSVICARDEKGEWSIFFYGGSSSRYLVNEQTAELIGTGDLHAVSVDSRFDFSAARLASFTNQTLFTGLYKVVTLPTAYTIHHTYAADGKYFFMPAPGFAYEVTEDAGEELHSETT